MPTYLADLLLTHHAKLKPWAPEDSATRAVQQLVFHRRAVVDERTGLSNRLIALLKSILSASPGAVRRGLVATAGHAVPAQMVQPAGGAKSQTGHV